LVWNHFLAQTAKEQGVLLDEVRAHLMVGNTLSRLEKNVG